MLKILSLLLHSDIQTQIFHHQCNSFSQHIALGEYYTEITPLIDALTEDYQGEFDIVTGYTSFKLKDYASAETTIKYFEDLKLQINSARKEIEQTNLQNQLDNIITLINTTMYKLKRLP